MLHEMSPLFPPENDRKLEDLALNLIQLNASLSASIPKHLHSTVGRLVRAMNCYYSNLIEGHNTHPRDIEKALKADYSKDKQKRDLQLEAKAHIEVQTLIEEQSPKSDPFSEEFIRWVHKEFCDRLPEDLLWVENPDTGERKKVQPGVLRSGGVQVGMHKPPAAKSLEKFLSIYEKEYGNASLSSMRKIISVAAAHHRLLWIHPFYDGNGRVTRFSSHAALIKYGAGSTLWSVARGLARQVDEYKTLLMKADEPRHSDIDGRGALSLEALREFCEFFLTVCIDQAQFMGSLLQAEQFLPRLSRYCDELGSELPSGSFNLLKHAYLLGEFERGKASDITGRSERSARRVLSALLEKNLLISDTPKGAVRINFPADILEICFPRLYPAL